MVQALAEENNDSLYKPFFQKTDNNGETSNVDWGYVCQIIFLLSIFGLVGFFLFSLSYAGVYLDTWPKFSLAVASVDGLSPSSEPSTTISPVFNLTLHVDNTNSYYNYCVKKGKTRVLYQLVEVAEAPTVGFCMDGFLGEKNVSIHAWHMELVLPGFLRDQLYEEVKEGKAVFDVQLLFEFDGLRVQDSSSRSFIDCQQVVASGATFQCKHSVSSVISQRNTGYDSFDTPHAN
ncbi:hypothetical protein LUZ63_006992 [Rhynchospora breviuscula]|uniref:Uncharacterized protein n=1 Tax=Rhynchospora breviuscula TaxID=2022672 RepID=A0A9Q0CRE6_9POAL|nr:hypothetical protein LUZ63_006992 [Rhynchospora breviuscula]